MRKQHHPDSFSFFLNKILRQWLITAPAEHFNPCINMEKLPLQHCRDPVVFGLWDSLLVAANFYTCIEPHQIPTCPDALWSLSVLCWRQGGDRRCRPEACWGLWGEETRRKISACLCQRRRHHGSGHVGVISGLFAVKHLRGQVETVRPPQVLTTRQNNTWSKVQVGFPDRH